MLNSLSPVTVGGELVLAVPQAGVAPPPLLPALGGHLLLLVAGADVGVIINTGPVKTNEVLPDIKPCDHWTILDQLKQFILIREVFELITCHTSRGNLQEYLQNYLNIRKLNLSLDDVIEITSAVSISGNIISTLSSYWIFQRIQSEGIFLGTLEWPLLLLDPEKMDICKP